MTAVLAVFGALIGMAVGSFLNVAVSRLPRGESILWPPSHCPSCSRRLEWWENIPVAGYIALRGRCRTCRSPIGVRHLVVEALAGAAGAMAAGLLLPGAVRG